MSDYTAEFMKFIASFTGDLSQMTCPAFLLNGYSLLEYSQHWGDHPDLLWDITTKKDVERMLAVTRWFVSTLFGSYRSRCETQTEKKPFNPILGEVFQCTWNDVNQKGWGEAFISVEQVSHHPPVSAFCVQIPKQKQKEKPFIRIEGHCGQRTTFSTTAISVTQVGRVKMTIEENEKSETFIVYPLPSLSVAGLLSMKVFVELLGKTKIVSSTGLEAEIEFIPKGWFSGEYFGIKGFVKKTGSADVYCTLGGKWTDVSTFTIQGKTSTLFDAKKEVPHERIVKPIQDQLPNETLRLWGECIQVIQKNDFGKASTIKTKIEEEQRALRKKRKEEKAKWLPSLFQFVVPLDTDKQGTTRKDPQHSGGVKDDTQGHWVYCGQ